MCGRPDPSSLIKGSGLQDYTHTNSIESQKKHSMLVYKPDWKNLILKIQCLSDQYHKRVKRQCLVYESTKDVSIKI